MGSFRFKNVYIESFAVSLPQREVSSRTIEERLAGLYEKLELPFGALERICGVRSRRLWPEKVPPSEIGTLVCEDALAQGNLSPDKIGILVNCSVARDHFEPATAAYIHRNLGLASNVMAFDITNACTGFSNGISIVGNLIESGMIEAGVVVSPENPTTLLEAAFRNVESRADKLTRDELVELLPTFTLGGGAVAFVLCNERLASKGHRVAGGSALTASEYNHLCRGNTDVTVLGGSAIEPIMYTESRALISAGAKTGAIAWSETAELLGWTSDELRAIFPHQIGKQLNNAFYKSMGLDHSKEYAIYPQLGNMVSAALPAAIVLGKQELGLETGDRSLCTGFGSGLNAVFWGIEW
jgi:acyl-CoA:acyl-CoA alkyltransferase